MAICDTTRGSRWWHVALLNPLRTEWALDIFNLHNAGLFERYIKIVAFNNSLLATGDRLIHIIRYVHRLV